MNASLCLSMALLVLACAPDAQVEEDDESCVLSHEYVHYVQDRFLVPTTAAQAAEFAVDVDQDAQGLRENRLGELFARLSAAGIDVQGAVDAATAAGRDLKLYSLGQCHALADAPDVLLRALLATDAPAPDFGGAGTFLVDAAWSPDSERGIGALAAGHFVPTGATTYLARLAVFPSAPSLVLSLVGARITADFTLAACRNGLVGGALTVVELDLTVLPALADAANAAIAADPGEAVLLLGIFDTDGDGVVTTGELQTNTLIAPARVPDLDLLDASGTFASDHRDRDGVADSISVGFGFHCVSASFLVSGEY